MADKIYDLTVGNWSNLFDIKEDEMPSECVNIINSNDFRYSFFSQKERDEIILDMMKKVDFKKYSVSGVDEKDRWEKGWQEILDNFISSGYDKESLIPQYNRNGYPIRLYGDYVRSCDVEFENNFIKLLRSFVFQKYLKDKNNIYEFGCGSCYTLLAFAEMSPEKYYYGYDWVNQSKKIIDAIRDNIGFNIYGGIFDMFKPDKDMEVKEDSVALTIGSLEQLGKKFDNFMSFLINKPFTRYVHLNSILEKYDIDNNVTDYLTYRLETSRNYCNGFFTKLKELEEDGIIKIITSDRLQCGGLLGDGYSITVWEKI